MYYKKVLQNRERGYEKKGEKYKESKMIMVEFLNLIIVYD